MTQYERITGKVFGGNATATGDDPQIAQFGSALANTFVGTTDPATIQQLPAWGQGWIGAVTPETQFPPLPEMTGAMKVLSHQICGILQQGVSTWDSGTIYYTGNFCSKNGIVYVSLSDINQGNDPEADTTNWRSYGGADIDLSNLSSQGQNIANWSTNVTNCITEIPQRIKYTLVDGTLTIKAGTVVIVPYGVEDLTAQYPKGATFLHENFKVYDTQFADGKFFVWAEIVEDIVSQQATTAAGSVRLLAIAIQGETLTNAVVANVFTISANTLPNDTISYQWYQTNTNKCFHVNASRQMNTMSFPIGICISSATTYFGSIKQIFNGFGYIGSTVWVDKGVKGLIPNGRNEDGTLNNNEVTINKFSTVTVNDTRNAYIVIGSLGVAIPTVAEWSYDEQNNYNIQNGSPKQWATVGNVYMQTGVITSFSVKQPFRVADYQDVVKKSGDTMTGNLTISQAATPKVICQNLNWDYTSTTAPSANMYLGCLDSVDKNGNFTGSIRTRVNKSGTLQSQMTVARKINGTDYTATTTVGVDTSGNALFSFPMCTTMPTTTSSARSDLVAVVVKNYVKGTSWYRVWSDGWKEQGGETTTNGTTVTFLKAFSNTSYTINMTCTQVVSNYEPPSCTKLTTTSFYASRMGVQNAGKARWYACGY